VLVTGGHGSCSGVVRLCSEQHGDVRRQVSGCGAAKKITSESIGCHHPLSWIRNASGLNSCKWKTKLFYFFSKLKKKNYRSISISFSLHFWLFWWNLNVIHQTYVSKVVNDFHSIQRNSLSSIFLSVCVDQNASLLLRW
jgi:hypothetical protein